MRASRTTKTLACALKIRLAPFGVPRFTLRDSRAGLDAAFSAEPALKPPPTSHRAQVFSSPRDRRRHAGCVSALFPGTKHQYRRQPGRIELPRFHHIEFTLDQIQLGGYAWLDHPRSMIPGVKPHDKYTAVLKVL